MKRISLSAGLIVRKILLDSVAVTQYTQQVFPVVKDAATLPYILYRRAALHHNPTKAGQPGADTVEMELLVYTALYDEGVDLAEAVRSSLDYACGEAQGLKMRGCVLIESEEGWENDAYVQSMTVAIKV